MQILLKLQSCFVKVFHKTCTFVRSRTGLYSSRDTFIQTFWVKSITIFNFHVKNVNNKWGEFYIILCK